MEWVSINHFICESYLTWYRPLDEGSNADISFKYNSGIKFLHIKNFDVDRDAWDPFPWLLHLLSSIRETNQLEEIRLEVDATNRSMDWSAWKEVDCTLASAHFECLRKMNILVWVHGDQYLYKSCEILVRCFPLLTEKGVSVDVRWCSRDDSKALGTGFRIFHTACGWLYTLVVAQQ